MVQLKSIVKALWQFCRYLFVPQWGRHKEVCGTMKEDIIVRLREFIENEMRSCSMDVGGITPLYVYIMWGGSVSLEEIELAMAEVRRNL